MVENCGATFSVGDRCRLGSDVFKMSRLSPALVPAQEREHGQLMGCSDACPQFFSARRTMAWKAKPQKLRAEAAVAKEKGEELQAASSLLGPKGGLPTLKRRTSFAQLPCYMWRSVVPRRSKRSSTRFARWWAHCGGTASSSGAPPVATPVLPVPAREPPQVHRTILDYSLARLGRWLPNQAPSPLRPSCWRK